MNSNNKPKQEQPKPQQPAKQQQIPKQSVPKQNAAPKNNAPKQNNDWNDSIRSIVNKWNGKNLDKKPNTNMSKPSPAQKAKLDDDWGKALKSSVNKWNGQKIAPTLNEPKLDFDDDYEQEFKDNGFDSNEKDVFDLGAEKHTESDQFKKDQEHNFDENNESEDLSVDENSNNSGEVGDLGHTLDELEDSGIFNVKMVDKEGNIVFDGNSMDAPLWDENGNEYAIDKIDKDELNRSGIIHLKSGSNNKSLELKHKQLEELIPEDKREQTKLLLDYFVNDLGIDEETALDSIIESAKKVKKL